MTADKLAILWSTLNQRSNLRLSLLLWKGEIFLLRKEHSRKVNNGQFFFQNLHARCIQQPACQLIIHKPTHSGLLYTVVTRIYFFTKKVCPPLLMKKQHYLYWKCAFCTCYCFTDCILYFIVFLLAQQVVVSTIFYFKKAFMQYSWQETSITNHFHPT